MGILVTNNLKVNKNEDIRYITFPSFNDTRLVKHCFTTKIGGVSSGIFYSMNLGYNRGDKKADVDENYKRICKALDINENNLVFSDQVHDDKLYIVSKKDIGKGKTKESDIKGIDGLITDQKNVPLITFYADCVPLFFLDPVKRVIALSHAGWRGTVKKIGAKTVKTMSEEFGCQPNNILVGIGPSIGQCCFEVGIEVADEFRENFSGENINRIIEDKKNSKYMIDLWMANKISLLEVGIKEDNITTTDICTKCNSDVFFSHRATDGMRGNLAAIMELK